MSAVLARVAVVFLLLAMLSGLVMLLPGCGRDDLGALLVRWPF